MQKDLQIGATASGIAGGIFFFGYLFLQVPGSLLAEKWSAKRFIIVTLLVWAFAPWRPPLCRTSRSF